MKTKHPVLWTAAAVAVATVLLYELSAGFAVDAVDDVVIASLSGTEKINTILALYFVVLGLTFAAAVVATLRSARGIQVAAVALWSGAIAAIVVEAGAAVASIPGYPVSWDGLLLVPAAFTWLATPAGFLVLQAASFIAFMVVASKLMGVE